MAITAMGATLSFTAGSTDILAGVCLRNIGEASHTRAAIDTTCYGSSVAQYIAGLVDLGTMEVTVAWKDTTVSSALQEAFIAGTSGSIVITLESGVTWTASGFITDLGQSFPRDNLMETTITFQLDGKTAPTWGSA